jgi:hypothetical protein
MRMMLRSLLTCATLLLASAMPAAAQQGCTGQVASGGGCFNPGPSQGLPSLGPLSPYLDRVFGSTPNTMMFRNVTQWAALSISGDFATTSNILALATVNANVGTFGSATQCPTITVSGKGLLTAASQTPCTLSAPGVDQNTFLSMTTSTAIDNTMCGKRVYATNFITVTLPAVAGFPATCRVSVLNGNASRGARLAGFPTCQSPTSSILWPLQEFDVAIENGVWAAVQCPGRWRFTASVTLNVDPAAADDTADGLATGSGALKTQQKAWDTQADVFDCAGQILTIQLADGTFSGGQISSTKGSCVGMSSGSVTINGHTGVPSAVLMSCGTSTCYQFGAGEGGTIQVLIRNMTVCSTGGTASIFQAFTPTTSVRTDNIFIGTAGAGCLTVGAHVFDVEHGAEMSVALAYTLNGNVVVGGNIIQINSGGRFVQDGVTFSVAGTGSSATAYLSVGAGGSAFVGAMTFVNGGLFTTSRFSCSNGGQIYGTGGNLLYLLGVTGLQTPGSIAVGCIYDGLAIPIAGTATNDNASPGIVGQIIESSVAAGAAVSLGSGTPSDVTSISVTAGDWHVCGSVYYTLGGGTTFTRDFAWINTTSATDPSPPNGGAYVQNIPQIAAGVAFGSPVGCRRYSFGTTTTVYLTAQMTFSVSTSAAFGYIGARRAR